MLIGCFLYGECWGSILGMSKTAGGNEFQVKNPRKWKSCVTFLLTHSGEICPYFSPLCLTLGVKKACHDLSPLPKPMSAPIHGDSPHLYARHDILWYRISLCSVWTICPSYAPFQFLLCTSSLAEHETSKMPLT